MATNIYYAATSHMHSNGSIWVNPIVTQETGYHYSCRDTIFTWLLVHFFFTWCITIAVLHIPIISSVTVVALISMVGAIRSEYFYGVLAPDIRRNRRSIDTSRRVMKFVLHEIKWIIFYVFAAVPFKLVTESGPIRSMTLACWLIEAFFLPDAIYSAAVGSYLNWQPDHFYTNDRELRSMYILLIRGPVFLVMRYAEMHPSSAINDYKTFFFYFLCDTPGLHHIPEKHRLRPHLRHVESWVS